MTEAFQTDSTELELLSGDCFADRWCVECGTHGALFATPHLFSACPQCLLGRIHRLQAKRSDLPDWVAYLEQSAAGETRRQAHAEHDTLSVAFDDFYRCGACGTLVLARDARYRLDVSPSPPYCRVCHAMGRIEPNA